MFAPRFRSLSWQPHVNARRARRMRPNSAPLDALCLQLHLATLYPRLRSTLGCIRGSGLAAGARRTSAFRFADRASVTLRSPYYATVDWRVCQRDAEERPWKVLRVENIWVGEGGWPPHEQSLQAFGQAERERAQFLTRDMPLLIVYRRTVDSDYRRICILMDDISERNCAPGYLHCRVSAARQADTNECCECAARAGRRRRRARRTSARALDVICHVARRCGTHTLTETTRVRQTPQLRPFWPIPFACGARIMGL